LEAVSVTDVMVFKCTNGSGSNHLPQVFNLQQRKVVEESVSDASPVNKHEETNN
jgi:hypothetical protein